MKMAILGSGPLAILAAHHFDQIGADVSLFQRSPLGGNLSWLMKQYPQFEIEFEKSNISLKDFFEKIIVPAVSDLEKYDLTKHGDVQRVHKRFLHTNESVPGRTRLHDLFRVVFSRNPQETILKQMEESPELFASLGEEVINSLHKPVESFDDFDIVIEARGFGKNPMPMGAGNSFALNENNLQDSSLLFYEKNIFTQLNLENKKTIILTGSGITCKLALLKFREWLLENSGHELHWVTREKADKTCGNKWLDSEVEKFRRDVAEKFDGAKLVYETKIREWRDLEDYVKAKVSKPIEPTPLLVEHVGYDVTSVDRLLDRAGVFATIESPDFRDYSTKSNDMMTLAADALCIANGVSVETFCGSSLLTSEPGFYVLNSSSIDEGINEIKKIEKNILNYFKKA